MAVEIVIALGNVGDVYLFYLYCFYNRWGGQLKLREFDKDVALQERVVHFSLIW